MRRLRNVARAVQELDPAQPDFRDRFLVLQEQAATALGGDGGRKGNPYLAEARRRAGAKRGAEAEERRNKLRPIIAKLREEGFSSYRQIAEALDARGIKPLHADRWSAETVRNIERK
ncbi:hypothetical protein SAMN05216548_11457 [Faunimonas pinastri]|uniref:Recombinase domain-containing protein n=2 Tax=Faunimonas pinastri TaxID=1855383 RepID=A0A1H9MUK4_9HYPH|nr:hypothetical protein SAMN05216548_11457 [Faunimonas pinastri]